MKSIMWHDETRSLLWSQLQPFAGPRWCLAHAYGGAACLKGKSCPAYGKKCTHCAKLNHFQKVCRSAKSTPADSVDNVMQADALGLTLQPTHAVSTMLQVTISGNEATMEVDTGAAVTLISEPMWRDLGSPTLQSSGKVFTAYDGHRMKPLGKFKCRLAHLQSTVNALLLQQFNLVSATGS